MKRLLIVYHTQFGGTAQMAEAAFAGARSIVETAQPVTIPPAVLARCREIGATLAAGLATGIY